MNRLPDDLVYNVATFLDYQDYYNYRSTTRCKIHHKPYDISRAIGASAAGVIKSYIADGYHLVYGHHHMYNILMNPNLSELHALLYVPLSCIFGFPQNHMYINYCDVETIQQLINDGTWERCNADFDLIFSGEPKSGILPLLNTLQPRISYQTFTGLILPLDIFEWAVRNGQCPPYIDMYITYDNASAYMAVLYRYRRDLFMKCTFEPLGYPMDIDTMNILMDMYSLLGDDDLRARFHQDLRDYHEWLWIQGPVLTPNALHIIKYINSCTDIQSGRQHMMYAIASPWKEYAQYLVLSGVKVERNDYIVAAKYNTIVSEYLRNAYLDTMEINIAIFCCILLGVILVVESMRCAAVRSALKCTPVHFKIEKYKA